MMTRIWRLVATCALLLVLIAGLVPPGGAAAQNDGTPAVSTETATEEPTETATEPATETPTEQPTEAVTETVTAEPTDPATETATAEPSETATATASVTPEEEDEPSFSIASVSIGQPVVSPSTSVHNGDTFTIAFTLSRSSIFSETAGVDLLDQGVFGLASTLPEVTSATPSACIAVGA